MPDFSTYAGRQAYRDAHPGVIVDASSASDGAVNTGPASAAPAPTPAVAPQAAGNPDLAAYVAAMQASSGFSIKELDEKKREFDATLAYQKEQWQQQGLPQLAIQQRAQALEEAKFKELTDQATFTQNLQTRQQDLAQQVQLGQLSIAQAQQQLAREVQTGQLRVSQGQLGLDTLKTAASLSGPENFIQAANFNRGVAGNAVLPGFVSDLLAGRSTAVLGGPAPGAQMSAPLTLQGIAAQQGVPQVATGAPAPMSAPAMDAQHMADFYSRAVAAANTGGTTPAAAPTTPGVATPGVAATPQYATPADVATTFGRTPQQAQVDASTEALRKVYAAGGQALPPQALEGLTTTENKMFQGGGAAIGADVPGYVEAYKRSRIGQTAAKAA